MTYNEQDTTGRMLFNVLRRTYIEHGRTQSYPYNDYDEVFPNILLGDGATAKNKSFLKDIGVTHVLNTAEGKRFGMVNTSKEFYKDTHIKYLGLPLIDLPTTDIAGSFQIAADFIDAGLQSGGKVYVHCLMGVSRSSSCVLAYLMIKRNFTAAEAIEIVRQKRSIHPNEGFLQQLADLDNQLRRKKLNVA